MKPVVGSCNQMQRTVKPQRGCVFCASSWLAASVLPDSGLLSGQAAHLTICLLPSAVTSFTAD